MAKERKFIKETGRGILNGLEDIENMGNVGDTGGSNEPVKEEKSISVKEEKSKRSFMLTAQQIQKLYKLKYELINKDLSDIVGEAIEMYYDTNIKAKA